MAKLAKSSDKSNDDVSPFLFIEDLLPLVRCSRRTLDRLRANNEINVLPVNERGRPRWMRDEVLRALDTRTFFKVRVSRGRRVRSRVGSQAA